MTRLQQVFNATGQMADWIREAVDTVERFQGQQRDVIIASYTLGDPDQIAEEDEFLMSLNRFNVIASRARAKLVLLVSQEVISHLAHNTDVLRESRLLKPVRGDVLQQLAPDEPGPPGRRHGAAGAGDVTVALKRAAPYQSAAGRHEPRCSGGPPWAGDGRRELRMAQSVAVDEAGPQVTRDGRRQSAKATSRPGR